MKRGDIFRRIPRPNIQKSNFDMGFDHRTTFDMGYLVPVLLEETLPGDSWNLSCEPFVRAAALIAPVMSRIDVRIDYFHVSNRILWPSWERWFKNELINKPPYVVINDSEPNTVKHGTLGDYLGLPAFKSLNNYVGNEVSAFPVAAYNFIWNEFYRHQHVQNEKAYELTNDDNTSTFLPFLLGKPEFRNWRHDYFTSANPYPVSGAAGVQIPITHQAATTTVRKITDQSAVVNETAFNTDGNGALRENTTNIQVYHDAVHNAPIEDLRRAIKVQEWLEKLLTGGTRFREMLWSFFGVDNKDMRMQVPEHIGSHVQSLKISEVLTTGESRNSEGNLINPVGQMAGHGVSVGKTPRFKFFARENGWILGLMSVQPKPTYLNQGIPKKFLRDDIYKYYFPQFAHLGEQPIENRELFIDDTEVNQSNVFGYQANYAEYKFRNNRVSGEFGDNLDFWTFARKFVQTPTLDETFIKASVGVGPFAVKDGSNNLRAMVYHDNRVVRPIPRFSVSKTGG